jgi:hypothetical protein
MVGWDGGRQAVMTALSLHGGATVASCNGGLQAWRRGSPGVGVSSKQRPSTCVARSTAALESCMRPATGSAGLDGGGSAAVARMGRDKGVCLFRGRRNALRTVAVVWTSSVPATHACTFKGKQLGHGEHLIEKAIQLDEARERRLGQFGCFPRHNPPTFAHARENYWWPSSR